MQLSFVVLLVAVTAQAPVAPRRIGVGVTMPDVGFFVPINLSARVRVEPYVNFQSTRFEPSSTDTTWFSFTQLGLGLFSVSHPQERISLYFGPRGGLLRGSRKQSNGGGGEATSKDKGWFIAGALGGEYSPADRLSMGAEARIQYDHASSESSGAFELGPSLYSRSWYSSGSLVVRFYP
jgi:hypothetical protein